ncbi:hypothetical protein [Methanococcus maripaludis]|uniref:Uncharacterized protein n=1 Tax=Methanococcus maripaludis TaxID=39152 RepID=A0A7J9PMD6_METMI|nr:hypothetical protein [Methanococcus maripaludis]MBA2864433.1 hypothetical protein [Methanococcus maripaludis]
MNYVVSISDAFMLFLVGNGVQVYFNYIGLIAILLLFFIVLMIISKDPETKTFITDQLLKRARNRVYFFNLSSNKIFTGLSKGNFIQAVSEGKNLLIPDCALKIGDFFQSKIGVGYHSSISVINNESIEETLVRSAAGSNMMDKYNAHLNVMSEYMTYINPTTEETAVYEQAKEFVHDFETTHNTVKTRGWTILKSKDGEEIPEELDVFINIDWNKVKEGMISTNPLVLETNATAEAEDRANAAVNKQMLVFYVIIAIIGAVTLPRLM